MSTPAQPTEATPPSGMPPSVRVAAITMGMLAALLLVNAGLLWYWHSAAVDGVMQRGQGLSRADAEQVVALSLYPHLVIGVILALAAWFLPRRQPWARWLGLAGSALLGLLHLVVMVAARGIIPTSLLLLVLSAAAVTSLLARTTGLWVPRLRSRA